MPASSLRYYSVHTISINSSSIWKIVAYWWGFTYNDVVPECYIITMDGLESEPFADLDGSERVEVQHISEAIGYRNLDRGDWAERRMY